LDGAESGPNLVDADVLVERRRVVERDGFELVQRRSKVVELGKTSAALRLDLRLNASEPTALEFDTLLDHFLSQPKVSKVKTRTYLFSIPSR
jgi:hypothetical protein